MKKLLLSLIVLFTLQAGAQTVILQQDFTTYAGTAGTVPAGWNFSYNGNYTTTASSGPSGPNSYKFGVNNATITSPMFAAGTDTLSFWIKGNGTDALAKLTIYESADSSSWTIVDSIKPLPTVATGNSYTFGLSLSTQWVKFIYTKTVGNLAFDDFKITQYPTPVMSAASFTSDAPVCPGDSVHFMNTSVNASSYAWDFGDGNTSTATNPVHHYSSGSGTYTVTLIANPGGPTADTTTAIISVISPPSFTISYANAYVNAPTLFYSHIDTANSTCSVLNYIWTFGDAASGSLDTSNLANPQHNYATAGTYHIRLRVQFSCMVNCPGMNNGWDSLDLQLTVGASQQIVANFMVPPTCEGQCAMFSDIGSYSTYAPINTYTWDFGDGTPVYIGSTPPCHFYAVAGNYNATLTVMDDSSHTATSSQMVIVGATPVVNIQSSASITCLGNSNCFTPIITSMFGGPPPTICNYSWDFGDGTTDNQPFPCHVYTSAGTYTVVLTVMSCSGCMGFGSYTITVDPGPTSNFSEVNCGAPFTKCFTDLSTGAVAWDWNFGDSNTSSVQNPTHTYAGATNYTVTLKVTNLNGCQDSTQQIVTTSPVSIKELNLLNSVNVFAVGQLIKISSAENISAHVSVYSLEGQLIAEDKLSNAKQLSIDMTGKSEGLYLVVVTGSDGRVARKVNLTR